MESTITETHTEVLDTLLARRHSVRAFRPELVSDDDLNRLFELSQRTASWCNTQPWQIHLVSGEAAAQFGRDYVDYASKNAPTPDYGNPVSYNGVYQDRRRQSGYALYNALGIAREDGAARNAQALLNFSFFGAPHAMFLSSDADLGTYGAVDVGGYISTFMLVAESMGIGTIAQAALAMHPQFVRDRFGLGEDRLIVAGVSFGYKDTEHVVNNFRIPRETIDNVVERRA